MHPLSSHSASRRIQRVAFILLPTDISGANRLYEAFQRRPPLGLQYLQAVLQQLGVVSELWDGILESLSPPQILARVREGIDLVGFYVSSMNCNRVARTVAYLKENATIPVIAGGPGSIHAPKLLEAGTDVVCMGEGEEVIQQIISSLNDGNPFSGIEGIAYREKGQPRFTSPRPLIQNLDTILFPIRDPKTICSYYDYK